MSFYGPFQEWLERKKGWRDRGWGVLTRNLALIVNDCEVRKKTDKKYVKTCIKAILLYVRQTRIINREAYKHRMAVVMWFLKTILKIVREL